jgi:small-conductance mechanosensitive channel
MTVSTQELIVGTGLLVGGLLLAWLISAISVIAEDRLSATPRDDSHPWKRAHRRALFWLLVTVAITLAARSFAESDQYATAIQRTAAVVGTVFGTFAAIRASNEFLSWYVRGRLRIRPFLSNTALPIVQRFAAMTVGIVAVVYLLNVFKQPVTPLLAIVSVFGFGIALAFRDTLANFFASTALATDGSIRMGDAVEIESEHGQWGTLMGTVVGIGWRNTRILTRAANIVSIPNGKLAESFVTNYSIPTRDMGVTVRSAVGLGVDLDVAEIAVLEVAVEVQERHLIDGQSYTPTLLWERLQSDGVAFNVTLRARNFDDSRRLTSDFVKALYTRLAADGIALAAAPTRVP